jgi:hypothetical protein
MAAINREEIYNVYLKLYMHDNNEIPTAIPKFSGSSETVELVRIFSHVQVTGTPNMAAMNRKYTYSVVYISTCISTKFQ